MSLKIITIPARAGGVLAFQIVDAVPTLSLWVELKRTLDDEGKRFEGVLVNASKNQWAVAIEGVFTLLQRGAKWLAVVCIETANKPADELTFLPVEFGIDSDFEPANYVITRKESGETVVNVYRLSLSDDSTQYALSLKADLGNPGTLPELFTTDFDAYVASHLSNL